LAENEGQKVLEQVREALACHTVLGLEVEGGGVDEEARAYLKNAGFRWEEGSFFHLHSCCGGAAHNMRVVLKTGEVWMNGQLIDDDWEASAGLMAAIYWDPRFIIQHLQNPELLQQEEGSVLRGTLNSVEIGIGKHDKHRLDQAGHAELVREIEAIQKTEARLSASDPWHESMVKYHKALSDLHNEAGQLHVDELRDRLVAILLPETTVELLLDERMLPVTVSWQESMMSETIDVPSRVHFSYV